MEKKEDIKGKYTKLYMGILIGISMLMMIQPAIAWGDASHIAMVYHLKNVPSEIKSYPSFAKGGGIATDMFFFLNGAQGYSVLSHTVQPADLGREILKLAKDAHSDKQKAFAYGWLSHGASDIVGHKNYINLKAGTDMTKHSEVEIGVDAHLIDSTGSMSFTIPYKLVQDAYRNIYGDANVPSYDIIYNSAKLEGGTMAIEKWLIKLGLFNGLKKTYDDYQPAYTDSISYSAEVINDPSILPNVDFGTGLPVTISSESSISNEINKQIKNDIREISIESVQDGSIDIQIEDDKINQYITVKEPRFKDSKTFENIKNKFKERIKQRITNTNIDELKKRYQDIINQIDSQ